MPKLTHDEIEAFLRERGHLCRIATVKPDGAPSVVPVWFAYEQGKIFITPRKFSEFGKNARREPRVAITVDEESSLYRKVLVEGRAKLEYDLGHDAEWRDLYRRISERYVDPQSAEYYITETIDQPRTLLSVALAESKVTSWRMPSENEPYSGIWARRYYDAGTKMAGEIDAGQVPARGDKLKMS